MSAPYVTAKEPGITAHQANTIAMFAGHLDLVWDTLNDVTLDRYGVGCWLDLHQTEADDLIGTLRAWAKAGKGQP